MRGACFCVLDHPPLLVSGLEMGKGLVGKRSRRTGIGFVGESVIDVGAIGLRVDETDPPSGLRSALTLSHWFKFMI